MNKYQSQKNDQVFQYWLVYKNIMWNIPYL